MAHNRLLIEGGRLLTLDARIGELERGDILIEDGKIAAVAPRIEIDEGLLTTATY